MIKDKKILVTGGAGFIGSHIVEYLLNNDVKLVRVVDNLSTGFYHNIEPFYKYNNFEFVFGDIQDENLCHNVLKDIDLICHQAALGSVPKSINDPVAFHKSNVDGFLTLLNTAKKCGIKRFVYASSSSVYGDNQNLPKLENSIGKQLSPYAITKFIDELYANIYTELYGMECIGLRYFNVFGPRQNPNGSYAAVIPKFINELSQNKQVCINGDGTFSRDFTFVNNVVDANIKGLLTQNKDCFGQVFNVGTGNSISIKDLYYKIMTLLGKNLNPIYMDKRIGDIPHSLANIDKAKKLLDYNPIFDLDTGLLMTINNLN